jgi:hypothetical protein
MVPSSDDTVSTSYGYRGQVPDSVIPTHAGYHDRHANSEPATAVTHRMIYTILGSRFADGAMARHDESELRARPAFFVHKGGDMW